MKQIVITKQPTYTGVCVVEDKKPVEFWVERNSIERLVGNIYYGKVMNVLPGMESAFVNIGLERNAFLYAGDMLECEEAKNHTNNQLNVKVGDEILVQVVKDQFGNKGARISMNISIAGRGLVLMPQVDYIGVSRKIVDDNLKEQLVSYVDSIRKKGHGYIIRTQAQSCTKEELYQETIELEERWEFIQQSRLNHSAPALIYKDQSLAQRAVRDMLRVDVEEIIMDDEKLLSELKMAFPHVHKSRPNLFKYFDKPDQDLFDYYGLRKEIEGLLDKKVVLENGAYLVIDRTEALTVIDVNTGKYVGEKDLSQTLFETNMIAAVEIARQLRLRNIGGIIVVDFIDMDKKEQIDEVMKVLQTELNKDRIKTSLIDMTPLGLVEITRKKTSSMIDSIMLQPCPYCDGDGFVESDEHVVAKIKTDLNFIFKNPKTTTAVVYLSLKVFNRIFAYRLLEKECAKEWKDKRIYLVPDENKHIEKYEIQGFSSSIIDLPDNARLLF